MNSSMFNGLDESLTTVLRSAISDNFPDSYQTYIRGIVASSPAPDGADFLTGEDVDLSQFFFSEDPEQNFPNTFSKYTKVVTSGSDINFASPAEDEEIKVVWGRHGTDHLSGFNPSADLDGKRRIDFLVGDLLDEQLFGSSPGPFMSWGDTFILGDWQTAYYVEEDENSLGLNQFALIIDFNPSEDIIQLHGTSQDYELVETSLGTAIFWRQGNNFDLIGVVGGIPAQNLSLDGNYFNFKGTTSPDTFLEKAEQIGTAGVDYLFSSSVDVEGNLYVGGGTDGSLAGQNLGARDAWLSKYDSNGNQLWSKQFGTSGAELIFDTAVDKNNDVYVTGNTTGGLGNNTNQGGVDVFLAKYDSDGNQEWIKQFGTVTFEDYTHVTTDKDGNVYLSGHTIGSLGGENQNVGQVLGQGADGGIPSTDTYIFKFDSDGNELWKTQLGTVTLDDNWGVVIDQHGNVFLGGNTKGDFGGENASSGGEYDSWLVKLNQNGEEEWVKQFGTSDYDFLWDLETDSMGNLYATGWTLGDLEGENAGSYDAWLAKYDTNGNQLWIKQFGTTGDDAAFRDGIEIDSNDNIFLAGYTDSDLGGVNAGSYDAWVAKYDTDGNQSWIQQFGTPDYDTASTVIADNDGNLYVSGITDGSLGSKNAGSYDSWVVKLDTETGKIRDFTGSNSPSAETLPQLQVDDNNVFLINSSPSSKVNLKAQLTNRNSNSVNEVGFFQVQDSLGTITDSNGNSLTPENGDAYIQAALKQSQVLFSAITNQPQGFDSNNSSRIIERVGGERFVFYFIENGTTDGVVSGEISTSQVTFGSTFNNSNLSQLAITNLDDDKWSLAWGGDKMLLTFEETTDSPEIGTGLQGGNSGELIDLRDVSGLVNADFSVYREAGFNNEVYFYEIDNIEGSIDNLNPTNPTDYLQGALNNIVKDELTGEVIKFSAANNQVQTGNFTIASGAILAPMIVINGNLSQLTDSNPNNDPEVYFPYQGVNSDGVDHIRLLGDNTFGFEDLSGGGDFDYNDMIVKMEFNV